MQRAPRRGRTKRQAGVFGAGGIPLHLPMVSLGETQVRPTAMLWGKMAAMAIEEMFRANPIDGVVLLGGCDKTIPALVMADASVDRPGHHDPRPRGDSRLLAQRHRRPGGSRRIDQCGGPSAGDCGPTAVLRKVQDLLDPAAPTVTGRPLVEHPSGVRIWDSEVVRQRSTPWQPHAGIPALYRILGPNGAVIKPSAVSPELRRHRGRAAPPLAPWSCTARRKRRPAAPSAGFLEVT